MTEIPPVPEIPPGEVVAPVIAPVRAGMPFALPVGAETLHTIADEITHAINDGGSARHAAEVLLAHVEGQLRGRLPLPLPADLRAVVTAAGVRYLLSLARARETYGEAQAPPELPGFGGFTFAELIVLHRYRRRTG